MSDFARIERAGRQQSAASERPFRWFHSGSRSQAARSARASTMSASITRSIG
jgi:hypothetical protein